MQMNAIFNFVTTAFTFIQGMAEQITPLINKFLDKQPAPTPPPPLINPNCQPPQCGAPPYYCPEEQLSSVCFQRRIALDDSASRRLATLSPKTDDDDNNEKKDKSSKSMSSSSTIMLVFVGVIALAIIGFLYFRCTQQKNYTRNPDDRKSSTWSV